MAAKNYLDKVAEGVGMAAGFAISFAILFGPVALLDTYTEIPGTAWWMVLLPLAYLHTRRRKELVWWEEVGWLIAIIFVSLITGLLYAGWTAQNQGTIPL